MLIGSADLMPRNLDNRVELIAPVRDPAAQAELLETVDRCLADNTHSWDLQRDGSWVRNTPGEGEEPRSVQRELMALSARRATEAAGAS